MHPGTGVNLCWFSVYLRQFLEHACYVLLTGFGQKRMPDKYTNT